MKTDLLIIPSVSDMFEDFRSALKGSIKAPWTVAEEVHTPFSLEEGEQLVIAVTKFTPGSNEALITYTVLPLKTIDDMRSPNTTIALVDAVEPEQPVVEQVSQPGIKITITEDPAVETTGDGSGEALPPVEDTTTTTAAAEPTDISAPSGE